MSMSNNKRVFALLRADGWRLEDDALVSPGEAIVIGCDSPPWDNPWENSGEIYLLQMRARVERIAANDENFRRQGFSIADSLADHCSLVKCLEAVYGPGS
jgi:hypothetical protein